MACLSIRYKKIIFSCVIVVFCIKKVFKIGAAAYLKFKMHKTERYRPHKNFKERITVCYSPF